MLSTDFRWSFSQWENYNQCPARWKYQSVLRLPRGPSGPAAARGTEMHDSVESYIKGAPVNALHPAINVAKYQPIFDQFRYHLNGDRFTEKAMGFDQDFTPSGGDSKSWLKMVLDAVRFSGTTLHIGEWKSGKPKDTHVDQRKMYALGGLQWWVNAEKVEVTTFYLEDTEKPKRLKATRESIPGLKVLWLGRVNEMQTNEFCAPRPGFYCKWCDYSRAKGGPCQF